MKVHYLFARVVVYPSISDLFSYYTKITFWFKVLNVSHSSSKNLGDILNNLRVIWLVDIKPKW